MTRKNKEFPIDIRQRILISNIVPSLCLVETLDPILLFSFSKYLAHLKLLPMFMQVQPRAADRGHFYADTSY